jgi:transcriptional regulator with XRE-family HTH domain
MTTPSDLTSLSPSERREFGFARARDAAFDAVSSLWNRRQNEGMTQTDIANALGSDPGWVSKNLRGPGNWTLRTFGAFVEALNGEARITIRALDDPPQVLSNYHAYVGYEPETPTATANDAASLPPSGSSPSSTLVQRGRGANTAILIP